MTPLNEQAPPRRTAGLATTQTNSDGLRNHYAGNALDALLGRLEKVKQTGRDRWMACCPAHQDRHPSLSIAETHDGTILIHDFGGCPPGDVLAAVGMRLVDLFPNKASQHANRGSLPDWKRRRFRAALDRELLVIEIAQHDIATGRQLSAEDADRVALASERISKLRGALHG